MTLSIKQLPRQAQEIASLLSRFCTQNDIMHTFNPANGSGHPGITIYYKGETRKLSFSATSSDYRAKKNAVTQLKRKLVELGWEPTKEKPGMTTKPAEDLFKNQKASNGAAGPAVVSDPKVVCGVSIPTQSTKDYAARNEAMLQAFEAGASEKAIHVAAMAAGWKMSLNSVSPNLTRARNVRDGKDAYEPRRPKKKTESAKPTITVVHRSEEKEPSPAPALERPADDLALEIAVAIAPVIAKHMAAKDAELDELRSKTALLDDFKRKLLA